MKYKLIAVDIDGTLINDQKIISQESINTIKRLTGKGVLFVISTGRPLQGIERFYKILNLESPAILYSGAMVVLGSTR